MADHGEARNHYWFCFKTCAIIILLIVFYHTVLQNNSLSTMEKRELLISTEIPVEYIDPTSIDLTPLVNTLINSTQSGSQQLFSLLSVTSHSSLALHKFTLLVYNKMLFLCIIRRMEEEVEGECVTEEECPKNKVDLNYTVSDFRNIETKSFPMRFCYCVSNKTNDLTDFTAILLDVMGNSTSYLQEIFKSSSILSVGQSNNSECTYICVMAGKTDRDLSQLWEMESIKPLFNQTITADVHKGNTSIPESPIDWHRLPTSSGTISSTGISQIQTSTIHSTLSVPATTTTTILRTTARMATQSPLRERSGCPRKRPGLMHVGGEDEELVSATSSTSTTAVSAQKLQSCLLELCKFFSRCLCRTYTKARTKRYCVDTHPWYVKYTPEICRRFKRIAYSENLKQKCLARMCTKL